MNLEKLELSENSFILLGELPDNVIVNTTCIYKNLKPITRDEYTTLGKKNIVPRFQKAFLNDYNYPGINIKGSIELPEELYNIFNFANNLPKELLGIDKNENFNQVLINFYDNGTQYIAPHADYKMKIVFSASFGQERIFRILDKKTLSIVKDIITKDRTFMIMCGKMQKEFLHTILQDNTQNKRLNITFRIIET
jgi:alkylated DNA repair dioxygenase AlkB